MRRVYGLVLVSLACGSVFLSCLRSTQAGTLYETGFEPSTFVPGLLHSQGGWYVGEDSRDAVTVSTILPQSGVQAVEMDGADLNSNGFGVVSAFARPSQIYATSGIATLRIRVDALLDGPSTDTGAGPNDDLISANLEAFPDPAAGYLGGMGISSSGEVWVFGSHPDDWYTFWAPITLGQYYSLELLLDFVGHTTTFSLSGTVLGVLPFAPGLSTETVAAAISLAAVEDLNLIDPADYTARFDNFSVTSTAVPEPSSFLTSLTAAIILGAVGGLRRHRRVR